MARGVCARACIVHVSLLCITTGNGTLVLLTYVLHTLYYPGVSNAQNSDANKRVQAQYMIRIILLCLLCEYFPVQLLGLLCT